MDPKPITDYVLTSHAATHIVRRGLTPDIIDRVLRVPEQRIALRPGRAVLQSRVADAGTGRIFLVRVFVDVEPRPARVVTAYRTSRIAKYWRNRS